MKKQKESITSLEKFLGMTLLLTLAFLTISGIVFWVEKI
jgi:hypothetical protein